MVGSLTGIGVAALAAVLLAATAWTAYLFARVLAPAASTSTRCAATAILGYAIFYVDFCLLLAVHRFALGAALVVTVLPAAALHRLLDGRRATATLRSDLRRAREVVAGIARSPWILAPAAVGGVALVRLLRGLAIPPLAWDALSYHLYKAGRWAQLGRHLVLPAPDSWGYYEHFPSAGDAYWAWTFLAAPDGALLAIAAALIWGTLLLGSYAAARSWGAREEHAMAAALTVASTPMVMAAMTASYVDNTLAALFVLALPFLAVGPRPDGKGYGEGALAAIALATGAAVKTSLLPVVGVTFAAGAFLMVKGPDRRRRAAWLVAFALPAAGILGMEYGATWIRTGSPTYPFPLRVAGFEIAAGNEELDLLMSGRLPGIDVSGFRARDTIPSLIGTRSAGRSDWTGLGPGAWALLLLGAAGTFRILRDPVRRSSLAIALLGAGGLLVAAYSPDSIALRGLWPETFARHVLPAWGLLAIAGAAIPWRRAWVLWAFALASSTILSIPRGWGAADARATVWLAVSLGTGFGLAWLSTSVLRARGTRPGRRRVLGAVLLVLPIAATLPGIRRDCRYAVWASAAAADGPYDLQGLGVKSVGAWSIWERLDGERSTKIAVAGGWNGLGQVWYLYPLLGSRLQNRVTYVSPTADGSVVDYREGEELARRASLKAWIGRLIEEDIDFVVTMNPSPPERINWMVRLPDVFVRERGDDRTDNYLYRFDRDAARRFLDRR